ncbi:glycosyltransferase [Flavobacterium sp. '19STA2R22 D10 B1']|uniref:glycosyltransferase n=1 Tax=Flavobacterium aerium TaxID=3037261 RepID=UPI00278C7C34|nr:glycosyltransferase [Flavobacterium sp. '19STA2R22 D10 B1']
MKSYKICLLGNCLSSGGAEKMHAVLSQYFASKNIEVHNVILIDRVYYSYSGTLLNLGAIKNERNDIFNQLKRLNVLRRFFKDNTFDYIIDFRYREHQLQEFLFSKVIFNAPYVPIIHSYMTYLYFPSNKFLAEKIYSNSYGIVAVCDAVAEKIKVEYNYENVHKVYNPIEFDKIITLSQEKLEISYQYVLGVGRMALDNIKQFDKMIEAYEQSVLPVNDVKLVLIGDGPQRTQLEELVRKKNLTDKIYFLGFQENPFVYMRKALFMLLTSRNEGFPNVINESLACGAPVVSFDCLSGPSEMIIDQENGLLVENQNVAQFILAMNRLYEDKALYENCKKHAVSSAERFSLENIGHKWLDFLKIKVS